MTATQTLPEWAESQDHNREVWNLMRAPERARRLAETYAGLICHPQMTIKAESLAHARLVFIAIGAKATREVFAAENGPGSDAAAEREFLAARRAEGQPAPTPEPGLPAWAAGTGWVPGIGFAGGFPA